MKINLGLCLNTNSVGWSLVEQDLETKKGRILGLGSRIIPMSQDVADKFNNGVSVSQTAERTFLRGMRRLHERYLLRRERLHRVLNILGFLPRHYASDIDFDKRPGQFKKETEPKLAWFANPKTGKPSFYFSSAFAAMLEDFRKSQEILLSNGKKIPHDWTIYYLRTKALKEKIEKEEIAWLILQFNQKRGYYQLRDEDEKENSLDKKVELITSKVVKVETLEAKRGAGNWYNIHLKNGWKFSRTSRTPLDWTDKIKEFIVTTELDENGNDRLDQEGRVIRSFRTPAPNDWMLLKKKTENDIKIRKKYVGEYIYEKLLANPDQKIRGKLINIIDRSFYKEELEAILEKQQTFHGELRDRAVYESCLNELYRHNDAHKAGISNQGMKYLFLNDILFYQRPSKVKQSLRGNCSFEVRHFRIDGISQIEPVKSIAKTHPLYQEFLLWQFLHNLRIFKNEMGNDVDITSQFLTTEEQKVKLFDWLSTKKEIKQETLLKRITGLRIVQNLRCNHDNKDKIYSGNITHAEIMNRLQKAGISENFLTPDIEETLWHILYSVEDPVDIGKALKTFSEKYSLSESFIEVFKSFPKVKKEYGIYSAKALKKLLPLMRLGKLWRSETIDENADRIQTNLQKLLLIRKISGDALRRSNIDNQQLTIKAWLEKLNQQPFNSKDFKGLGHQMASYIIYGRQANNLDTQKWQSPADIDNYLQKGFKPHALRNPIVEGIIIEMLRVVKDIWEYYGNGQPNFFNEIHVEIGWQIKNPAEIRRVLTEQKKINGNTQRRISALLSELLSEGIESVRPHSSAQQETLKIYEEGVLIASGDNLPEDIEKISRLSQPSPSELKKYRLWLEDGYRSPYTGEVIRLDKVFTQTYTVGHIIPQSIFFDDSLSNKIICETEVNNYKRNQTGYNFIKLLGGSTVPNTNLTIQTLNDYQEVVKQYAGRNKAKAQKLSLDELSNEFIERHTNDVRFISRVVKELLSNIVRENDEQNPISKKVLQVNDTVTNKMKLEWDLRKIWDEALSPRFERLNVITGSCDFGVINPKTGRFSPTFPLYKKKEVNKTNIDHRYFALSALVNACVTREHIDFLYSINSQRSNMYLMEKLLHMETYSVNENGTVVEKIFKKPWHTFTEDANQMLEKIIVSFQQNTRVLTKTANYFQKWIQQEDTTWVKKRVPQTKGAIQAVRKPMHKDTFWGSVKLKFCKIVSLSTALDSFEMITDNSLRQQILSLVEQGYDKKKLLHYFNGMNNQWDGKDIGKTEILYWDVDANGEANNTANRVPLDETFFSQKINEITDSGIQKVLLNHLSRYNEENGGKIVEHPELAFSTDGMELMNKGILELNNGKQHKPIYKVRIYESLGNKFRVGQSGNKKRNYVEAAKGTNLFFAIYKNNHGRRIYETIPMHVVIKRKNQGLSPVPEINKKGANLLISLSPNDLVYVPDDTEHQDIDSVDFAALTKEQVNRIYKMVSSSGNDCHFLKHNISMPILEKVEFTAMNKSEKSIEGVVIKKFCVKLITDRLGNVRLAL